eukprot:m.4738 g.4738  ORF g.4738 m.4738 type:complete len:56 (-) comp3965_c0_seq2:1362-1529(-)
MEQSKCISKSSKIKLLEGQNIFALVLLVGPVLEETHRKRKQTKKKKVSLQLLVLL